MPNKAFQARRSSPCGLGPRVNTGVSGDKSMKALALLLTLIPLTAAAGGDAITGTVRTFSGESGSYHFQIVRTSEQELVGYPCTEFDITVEYQRVPWYSWLPFVHSSHPTEKDTEAAALYLKEAAQSSREVSFGYMGGGLMPTDKPCAYRAKGLELLGGSDPKTVVAYHEPV